MKKAGVIGWPVSHSLSPRLHGYWLKQYGIAGDYVALPVPPDDFTRARLDALVADGHVGFNVTIPHKEAALALVDSVDHAAQIIGAVNTIIARPGGLLGTNTDWIGFRENLLAGAPSGWSPAGKAALVLGAGGAARGILYALADMGAGRALLLNRTLDKADRLAGEFAAKTGLSITAAPLDSLPRHLADADLLVNTTSLGMKGHEGAGFDLSGLRPGALVTDIVYNPLETPLLAAARGRGNPAVDGLGMLLHQGAPGFEAWFGVRPEVTPELRAYMEAAL